MIEPTGPGLTDPLLPLLRPAAIPRPPLLLDATDIRLRIVPPIVRLILVRTFTNREPVPIEAVLTMPPALAGAVVHDMTVSIGDRRWSARARARRRAEGTYDAGAIDGNRAILLEELKQGWQALSVAGVRPGETVALRFESVIGVGETGATLRLSPGVDPDLAVPALPDHLLPRHSAVSHPIMLTIEGADAIRVLAAGRDLPPRQRIDGMPMVLEVVVPAGFEGALTDRSADDVRAEMALHCANSIAALLEAGGKVDRAQVRDLAVKGNLLTPETSLVFVGPEGEASGVLPAMRKLALVDARPAEVQAVPAAMPPDAETVAPVIEAPPLGDGGEIRPGRRGRTLPRFPIVNARAPWTVRLGNWLRDHLRPRTRPLDLPLIGRRLRSAAGQVLWRQDGMLALRSGDPVHLPAAAAGLVREVAAVPVVRDTAAALHLTPDHLVIALLARAAARDPATPPGLLDQLFFDAVPQPFERLAKTMELAA
jgi:hypothetical protein